MLYMHTTQVSGFHLFFVCKGLATMSQPAYLMYFKPVVFAALLLRSFGRRPSVLCLATKLALLK